VITSHIIVEVVMQLHAVKLGFSTAIAMAILWVICSSMVYLMPDQMRFVSAQMVHIDSAQVSWSLNWFGFFIGLVSWSFVGGVTVWLVASIFNILATDSPPD
jgi:hypothetical protein